MPTVKAEILRLLRIYDADEFRKELDRIIEEDPKLSDAMLELVRAMPLDQMLLPGVVVHSMRQFLEELRSSGVEDPVQELKDYSQEEQERQGQAYESHDWFEPIIGRLAMQLRWVGGGQAPPGDGNALARAAYDLYVEQEAASNQDSE